MPDERTPQLSEIVERFRTGGRLLSVEPLGSGHIHDTYVSQVRLADRTAGFVHQRINRSVFASPEELMQNIERVTSHLQGKILAGGGDPERRVLSIVPTVDGESFLRTGGGDCWRTYKQVEGARTFDAIQDAGHARSTSRAFAQFQLMVADLPGPRLHETIRHFGDTRRRFEALVRAVEADQVNRAASAEQEIRFANEREDLAGLLVDLLRQGRVPERIAHHDTKINNVMIDDRTGEGVCVIDLDTVMPGTVLYDFGDSIRLGATRAAEDERDLSAVKLDLALFDRFAAGYLEVARAFLTPAEIDHLVEAARAVTFTIGVRFLTDHVEGDVYFRSQREQHNLDRCRTQFALVEDMELKIEQMQAVVDRYR